LQSSAVLSMIDRSGEAMQSKNTSNPQVVTGTRIHWGRIVLAAIMSEAGVVVVLVLAGGVYTLFGGAATDSLGAELGYYVAPATGVVTTLLAVLWVARPLGERFIAHGMLVGVGSVLLTAGFIFSAAPEHRLMYVVAFVLRLLAGWAGGALAQRRFRAKTADTSSAHGTGAAA
jgi:hypothetical protein